MSLQDCVALACTYLDDTQLHAYITKVAAQVEKKGLIHGLFLTGLTESGIRLLTNFVNQVLRVLQPKKLTPIITVCLCRRVTYRRPVWLQARS